MVFTVMLLITGCVPKTRPGVESNMALDALGVAISPVLFVEDILKKTQRTLSDRCAENGTKQGCDDHYYFLEKSDVDKK